MKVKIVTFAGVLLYGSLILLILSPFISTSFGMPRVDTGLMPIYLLLTVLVMFTFPMKKELLHVFTCFLGIAFFSFISLILNFSLDRFIDVNFFCFILFLFYFSYLYLQENALKKIRVLLFTIFFLISIGFFLELLLGVQLVSGNDQLEVSEGAFKGFFFNTNDQAVVVTALSAAISFFYILKEDNLKIKLFGYIILLVLGLIVLVSASRAALVGYLFIILITFYLNSNKLTKLFYGGFSLILMLFIFDINKLIPILKFLAQFSWLERSIQRFELAIFALDEDNSVGYRAEIYQKFLENFKIVWLGYGPRNYENYFNISQLSYSLGYTNPHSFFIEIYLAFGVFSLILFLIFLFYSIIIVVKNKKFYNSQKIFCVFYILLFCWLIWIPSSILRLPLVWYPIFLILIYSIFMKNENLNNIEGPKNAKTFT